MPAQTRAVPSLDWRTIETKYFVIHYPRSAQAWTLDVARRIDAVHDAVGQVVGNAPTHRVTIIVEDPSNQSNGYAIPMLEDPLIYFWPMPPDPTSGIGDSRGWGEILSVHEYTHIAHLTRPTRNPWALLLTRLSPLRVGPIAVKSPRWIDEGYATYVEGKLTGSGRPHSPWRAAVLREWALEGKLPTYAQLDVDNRFLGGDMAYLAGSAFLEWLVQRQGGGDTSLVHLWRRMSAREDRTFDESFAGVFGGYPADLYGRFTAELTGRALDVERALDAAVASRADSGRGTTVQALAWGTGAPAVSPNGRLLAIALARRNAPGRVVIWNTAPDASDTAMVRRRARLLALDPEDVPAVQWRPAPKAPLATLFPHAGFAYAEPRFMPNGRRVMLVRRSTRGDGLLRDDVFLWDPLRGTVHRVTHDAGIRSADPAPDGRHAVADRCVDGICDVVLVDLQTGAIQTLAAGAPRLVYYRPRYSVDGSRIIVSAQRDGRWDLELIDLRAAAPTPNVIGRRDGVDRYEGAFLPGDTSVVFTCDSGGIPNIAVMQLASGAEHALTAVTGAASAPEPDRRSPTVFFLRLHADGLDLASVSDTASAPTLLTSPELEPATVPAAAPGDSFATAMLQPPHAYGAGPRNVIVLPTLSLAAEGKSLGVIVAGTDPVGRLTWAATGLYGDRGTWRGASLGGAWRGWPVAIAAEGFFADERPSEQHGLSAPAYLDAQYIGGDAALSFEHDYTGSAHAVQLGSAAGRLDGAVYRRQTRALAFAQYVGAFRQTPEQWRLEEQLTVNAAAGHTADSAWARARVTAGARVALDGLGVVAHAMFGQVSRGAPAYEGFALGGTDPMLYDQPIASERVGMPAAPLGIATGRRVATYRVDLPIGAFSPYFWSGSAGESLHAWHRIVGIETAIEETGVTAIHVPDMRVVAGAGYSLDDPIRHHTTFYLSWVYRP
ncbi:MAG TPA: hypothetical protein VJO52_04100 [Gemmatimonadaceae bacterium]|nr:hypothetical protein [Gemmatimonadaceae bacterium]